ncbi:hypothetical protein ES332_A06G177600v1 [Gossypium tomentosum]|uniref:Uncharacterized protein n=1 Tax=Gossypium tomentosum TaxID=34277 RepID=A0A5D2Q5R5_GOSTO|nr:hypothetical protein ES332_A06G177600v1 [Gossypium tomentosum]
MFSCGVYYRNWLNSHSLLSSLNRHSMRGIRFFFPNFNSCPHLCRKNEETRMRFHLSLQRNNLKANGMIKILMTLILKNHGRIKMNLLRLGMMGFIVICISYVY